MVDGDLAVVDELYDPGLGERVEVGAEQQLNVFLLAVAARSAKYTFSLLCKGSTKNLL
jgi:hypothetical protein